MATIRADHEGAIAFHDAVAGAVPGKCLLQRRHGERSLLYRRCIGWNGAGLGNADQPESCKARSK